MAGNRALRCSKPISHQYLIFEDIWEQFWENRIFAFFDHLDLWVLHTFWVKTEKTVYKPVFTVYNRFLVGLNFQKPFRAVLNGVSEKKFRTIFQKISFPQNTTWSHIGQNTDLLAKNAKTSKIFKKCKVSAFRKYIHVWASEALKKSYRHICTDTMPVTQLWTITSYVFISNQ